MNKHLKTSELPAVRTTLPVGKLRFGHDYPGNDVHARRSNRGDGVPELAASVHADGVLQSLLVCPSPDAGEELWYVIDGNRRLLALQLLAEESKLRIDSEVPVIIRDGVTPGSALALSLAASIHNLPLHIVDRYEAFKAVSGTDADLAARFGTGERIVAQARALGALAPVIRTAWRAGEIEAAAAQAFTMVKSHKDQEKLFTRLQKDRRLSESSVRGAIGFDRDTMGMVKVVGLDACVAAGITVNQDLFGENHVVSDPAKVALLLNTHIDDRCRDLEAQGWSWALADADAPAGWGSWNKIEVKAKPTPEQKHQLSELRTALKAANDAEDFDYDTVEALEEKIGWLEDEIRLQSFSEADKARGGCIVRFEEDGGRIEIRSGLIRPKSAVAEPSGAIDRLFGDDKKKKAKAKPAPKSVDDVDVSQALTDDLAKIRTRAAARAIVLEPDLALAAIVAGFATQHGSPVCVSHSGAGDVNLSRSTSFLTLFDEFRALKRDVLLGKLAHVAAAALRLSEAGKDKGDDLLADSIADKAMQFAIKTEFAPADYFARVPKALILLAIKETLGEDEQRRQSSKGKTDLAEFAAASVAPKGWLPPELRTAQYAGPGSKSAPAAKVKAKPAKAKKKAKR